MPVHNNSLDRASAIYVFLFLFLLLLTSCARTSTPATPGPTKTVVSPPTQVVASPTATVTPTATVKPTPTSTPRTAPTHYTSHLVLRGVGRPDDLAFDPRGRLLFSDEVNGTVSRVNADGTVTVLMRGLAGPEGIVVLPDGAMIIAEQDANRIVSLAPGAKTPTILRVLPGTPSNATCKHGVDGIALDPTTNTLIVPDSPTGEVYRMSLDGKTFTRLSSGIVRPVGAGVDEQGNIYIADECGNAVWRITPSGNLLVIDLDPSIHALIRFNLASGKRETLASRGFIEPQGLVVDPHGNIFVADDYANIIVEFKPG